VVKQGFIENDLGVAAIGKAADEIGPADILAINIEAEAGRKQHAKRRQHAQDAGLLVGGLQHHHRQADLRPVVGYDVLHQGALLAGCAGRSVADNRPSPVRGFDLAGLLGIRLCGKTQAAGKHKAGECSPENTVRFWCKCHFNSMERPNHRSFCRWARPN
jgi:hypothetical protein